MFEVYIGRKWTKTTEEFFRSFTGARCLDGKVYQGPRYKFKTEEFSSIDQRCIDLCADCANVFVHHTDRNCSKDIVCYDCGNKRELAEIDCWLATQD